MHHLSDLGSLSLIWITPKERSLSLLQSQNIFSPVLTTLLTTSILIDPHRIPIEKKNFATETTQSVSPGKLSLILKGITIDSDGPSIREETY